MSNDMKMDDKKEISTPIQKAAFTEPKLPHNFFWPLLAMFLFATFAISIISLQIEKHETNESKNDVKLNITCSIPNAKLTLNDEAYGTCPSTITVQKGREVTIRASLQAYIDAKETLAINAETSINLKLTAKPYLLNINQEQGVHFRMNNETLTDTKNLGDNPTWPITITAEKEGFHLAKKDLNQSDFNETEKHFIFDYKVTFEQISEHKKATKPYRKEPTTTKTRKEPVGNKAIIKIKTKDASEKSTSMIPDNPF